MVGSVGAMAQVYARDYIRKARAQSDTAARRDGEEPPPLQQRSCPGASVLVVNRSGVKPFSMSWKNAPSSAVRLKGRIASLSGRIERTRTAGGITEQERRRKIAAYRDEMTRAKRQLAADTARQPVNILIVES